MPAAHVRDRFSNIGIGYILCGYYLMHMGGTGREDSDPVAHEARNSLSKLFYKPDGELGGRTCCVCCSDECLRTELCRDLASRDFKNIAVQRDYWQDTDEESDDPDGTD